MTNLNKGKLIRSVFRLICVIVLGLVLCANVVNGQSTSPITQKVEKITDDNFKKKIAKDFVVVVFTSKWQEKNVDKALLKGIAGYQKAVVITVASEDTKKVVKKLRLRNFPSLALFHNGSKKEVWKADMDGIVDVKNKDIKKAIDDVLAGDVF
jgi:thioredoxin-like negative regulator of GroEL